MTDFGGAVFSCLYIFLLQNQTAKTVKQFSGWRLLIVISHTYLCREQIEPMHQHFHCDVKGRDPEAISIDFWFMVEIVTPLQYIFSPIKLTKEIL